MLNQSAILHNESPRFGMFCSIVMIFINWPLIVFMALIFNQNWSLVWLAGWIICVSIDLIVGQTIVMWMYHEVVPIK